MEWIFTLIQQTNHAEYLDRPCASSKITPAFNGKQPSVESQKVKDYFAE